MIPVKICITNENIEENGNKSKLLKQIVPKQSINPFQCSL